MSATPEYKSRWADEVDSDDESDNDDIPNEFDFGDIDSKQFQALTCPAVPISDLDFSFLIFTPWDHCNQSQVEFTFNLPYKMFVKYEHLYVYV